MMDNIKEVIRSQISDIIFEFENNPNFSIDDQVDGFIECFRPWISVEDQLPDSNGYYICWCNNEAGLIHYHKDTGWQNGFYNDLITHWMPVPEPPQS